MKFLSKSIQTIFVASLLVVGGPVVLGYLGFWGESFADSVAFKAPYAPEDAPLRRSYRTAVERAAPAVVSIQTVKEIPMDNHPLFRDPFFRQFFGDPKQFPGMPQESQPAIGSGVIVSSDGYVLTNNHVIKDADEITIKLADGRSEAAEVIGTDPDTDLAILKVNLKDLPVIAVGSSDNLAVGDVVLAIGNPFGVGQTVTQGIVSATQRSDLGLTTFENYIQTDAAINPGNSGGALVDTDGNLVAINNAIFTRSGGYQGIGFAIPIDTAKDIMGQLVNDGFVTRGWLGVHIRPLTSEARESLGFEGEHGVVVMGVLRGGPASKAGVLPGDVITHVADKPVKQPRHLLQITSQLKPDAAYPLTVVRDGEILDLRVKVGKRPTKKSKPVNKPGG